MAVRIGTNPIAWSNDDLPSLGGDTPLEICLKEAREAGFTGIEMGGKFPRTAAAMRPLLDRHGLDLVSGWYSGELFQQDPQAEWEALLPHLALLRDMGCRHVVYADTSGRDANSLWAPPSRRPRLMHDEWPAYGRRLTALAERMADFGVGMAVHHHMVTIVESEADIDNLLAASGPAVGLLFDSGHARFAGADPARLLARHARRVVHVHCKDIRADVLAAAREADTSFLQAILDGVFTVPGDGCIDFAALMRILAEAGYAGWLVVEAEQDPAKAPSLRYARLGHDNLLAAARAAGLAVTA